MSEHSKHSHKDPVRIVYHAGDRTFARLFNERSLEEVKDVVREKLGLEPRAVVSLKQMGSGALLDLEDDGDFQAFRVLLGSSVSVDIQVTVSRPQDSPVPPPLAPQQPREKPPAGKQNATTSSVLPSGEPAGVTTSSQLSVHPEVAHPTEASITPAKTRLPSARKRKASLGDVDVTIPDKPPKRRVQAKPTAVTPIALAKPAESTAAPRPTGIEEPQKKKRKKESTKKDVETIEVVESPATKAFAPIAKVRSSTTLGDVSKDTEPSEPLTKKRTKAKKGDSTRQKKSSASVGKEGMNQSISQPSNLVIEDSLLPAVEDPAGSSAEGDTSKARKSEKAPIGACAAIPQTTASTIVQSEVAAAILSGYLSKPCVVVPPEPPAKQPSVRRYTKKSSVSSSAPSVEPTAVVDAPAHGSLNVPTEHSPEEVNLTNEPPQQTLGLNGPPCPICLGEPFHIRYWCPTVLKGPGAIRERLEELKRENTGDQQSLINQLEGLLHDAKVSQPTLNAAAIGGVQPKVLLRLDASPPRTPNIPSNSQLSEVTVENRDEGSSSDSSDGMSEGVVEHQESSTPQRQKAPGQRLLPSDVDLEAVTRGPASKRQSVLHLVDRIVDAERNKDSGSEESEAELEEDSDSDARRPKHRSSMRIADSSDTGSEEEEFGSPSPSRPVEDAPNNLGPGVQGSNKSVVEPTEHQDDDVAMAGPVDSLVPDEQHEGTHVGSENPMVVDELTGGKGAATVADERLLLPVLNASTQTLDGSGSERQNSGMTEADATPTRDDSGPAAAEVLGKVGADPIEPADDLGPLSASRLSNADPIEAPAEEVELLPTNVTRSTLKPGASKRIKTRHGEILEDEADRPVLVEHLASQTKDEVTPASTKGKPRGKAMETPGNQKSSSVRRSPRFSSVPPLTTPTPVVLLAHRPKLGARTSKVAKKPAKPSEEQSDPPKSITKGNATQHGASIVPTPSLNRWETLSEPASPPLQPDEPSVLVDELMSSSSQPDPDAIRRRPNDTVKNGRTSSQAGSSQGRDRLFDLSSSQIPFPYSQKQFNPVPVASLNGKKSEGEIGLEIEPTGPKRRIKTPNPYRTLSQLASGATFFSPSLPTPARKSVSHGRAKKRAADEDSSSSSSSDADEADRSEHIPRGRRAGSALETKKRKSLL